MLTDILHDEGPLTGLTPVNVHGAVYTETIIVVQVEDDARGAAEELNVLLTHRVELQKPSYIYLDIFCEGNVSKARPRFLLEHRHFCAPSTLVQPPDKVAENYILIYRGGQEALFIASPWVGAGEQHMHKHQSVSAGSCCLAPARKPRASRAVRLSWPAVAII